MDVLTATERFWMVVVVSWGFSIRLVQSHDKDRPLGSSELRNRGQVRTQLCYAKRNLIRLSKYNARISYSTALDSGWTAARIPPVLRKSKDLVR